MPGPADNDRQTLDERFRRALDSILDLVVVERAIRDDEGTIVDFEIEWMNNAPVDVAGRPREQLIGHRISELYPALAGGELIDAYRRVVETGEPFVLDVMPYEDVIDGREVSGYYTVQASKFEDGVLIASRDITPLETSRRELEIALQELEAAQRLAQLGIWRLDVRSGVVTVSPELREMYGLTFDETSDPTLASLSLGIHDSDKALVRDAYRRAMSTREAVVIDHRVVHRDGSIGYVRSYAQPLVKGDEVVGIWGTTQDVTERVVNRAAFEAEHLRRVAAEAIADLASKLNLVATRQDVANAIRTTLAHLGDISLATLGLVERDEPLLRQYFAETGVPVEFVARYMRTPLAIDTPMTRAATTGQPVFLNDEVALEAAYPTLVSDFRAIDLQTFAVVPLERASGEVFGALGIGFRDAYDIETPQFHAVLEEVGEICGRTIERLEVRDLEQSVAHALQLGLLSLDVRSTSAIVRARYKPADTAMEIGGDWYDAVDIGDGRLAVAVGDVVGRGLSAATTMGQLRAALGITALQAIDPAHALRMLDRYAAHVAGAECATVAFAVVEPGSESVSFASAGHPPPLLVTPDGHVRFLDESVSWPLGVQGNRARPSAHTAHLPACSLLLLYTDGLVERRGESLDRGLERLAAVVGEHWYLPLRRVKQAIFGALVDDRANDDIALVALRTVGATERVFADAFPADHSELPASRRRLHAWLVDAVSEFNDGVLVAVGEAVANAIDHGSDDASQIVRVEACVTDTAVVISVSDSGQWQPGIEGYFTGRGRGHLLMRAFADDVDIDTDQHGTIVTLTFARTEARDIAVNS